MTALDRPDAATPEEALARWREAGDPADLARLFDLTAPDLYRLALHLVPDEASAEDALQETFLAVLLHGDRYEPGRPARPWLAAILRHHAANARRRERRTPDPDRRPPPPTPPDPALLAEDAEERERLHEELKSLPEPYRGVALLRWRYGLDPAAIAEVRGVPVGTVGSWLHRALAKLKVRMGALPALLLAFRETRGLDGIREALVRRAASEAAAAASVGAGVGGIMATGGIVMASKIAFVGAGAVVAAVGVWMLWGKGDATPGKPGTPPAASEAADPTPPPGPRKEAPPEAPAPKGSRFDPAAATATIKVKATVKGNLPPPRPLKFDADAECARLHGGSTVLEQSIVAKDGKLANVIAYVSKGAERWTYEPRQVAVVLDQKGCMYDPHVFTVQVNQPIAIRNSDPTMHNIHAVPKKNDEWNKSQSKGAADLAEKFTKEEVAVRIKCDVHGWMQSWAGVFSHPFHGVTGDDGSVALQVPAGEYEVSAWQESDKLRKPGAQTVTIAAGETKEVEFVYEAK